MRFVGIVGEVFFDYANDLNAGYSAGNAGHPEIIEIVESPARAAHAGRGPVHT